MTPAVTLLVVEHNETLRRVLQQMLGPRYTVLMASCWTEADQLRRRADVDAFVVDVVDLTPSDATGLSALCGSNMPVVLVARTPPRRDPVQAGQGQPPLSALLARPVPLQELAGTLDDVIADRRAEGNEARAHALGSESSGILAESAVMRTVMELVDRAALHDTPVLLMGESGTGKELLARALHKWSRRAPGPFVALNCSAIPETLLESELFGHRRGAFTDARDDQRGLFQSAHGGTIFLDEIGDMALPLQGKLLRVLQEKEVHPLGAPAPVPTDVRIVTATHRDLTALVAEKCFREDLLYRINVIEVRVPPLRERHDDLVLLVRHLLHKHGARLGKPHCTVTPDAMKVLQRHTWPGNVRELENVIERALVLGAGTTITQKDLPDHFHERPSAAGPDAGLRLADVEREHIAHTLRTMAGNKAATARVLGVDRKTLYRKLTQHRIATRSPASANSFQLE